jgi:hypothetical protein
MNERKRFNYCVGFYWPKSDGQIGTYTYGRETFFGTLTQAKEFREYCQTRPDNKGKEKRKYKIFQLVEIPE